VVVTLMVGAASAQAEDRGVVLPTLLIKGEIVSVDANDPTATLVKVKDRYGFETPIYLTPETQITQANQTVTLERLSTGSMVEVEYNFDVNTAKRHAVGVTMEGAPEAEAAAPEAAEEMAAEVAPGVDAEAEPVIAGAEESALSEGGGEALAEDTTQASGEESAAPEGP